MIFNLRLFISPESFCVSLILVFLLVSRSNDESEELFLERLELVLDVEAVLFLLVRRNIDDFVFEVIAFFLLFLFSSLHVSDR